MKKTSLIHFGYTIDKKNRYNGYMPKKKTEQEQHALVIGASGLDVVGRMLGPLDLDTSNPAQIQVSYGGVARNVAENLAKLGCLVHLISVVGNDGSGHYLMDHLKKTGVDMSGCLFSNSHSTGVYMAMLSEDGSRAQALYDRSIMNYLTPTNIQANEAQFVDASIVFFDANLTPEAIKAVVQMARKHHVPICADPSSTSLAPRLKPYLKHIHILTLNSAEAARLSACDSAIHDLDMNIQAGRKLLEKGTNAVIIAMGEYGVCYVTTESTGHIPAISTPIIDPTGAGDAFTSAVLYGYLNGLSIDDGIRLGVSAASLTIRTPGSVVTDLSLEKLYDNLII